MHSPKPKISKIVPKQVQYVNLMSNEGKIMETDGQIMDYHSVLDEILKDIDGFKIRPFLL